VTVLFIIPSYNAQENIEALTYSIISQQSQDWRAVVIDDCSESPLVLPDYCTLKFHLIRNDERQYALKNIISAVKAHSSKDDIIAVIDGDDSLCNVNTVDILMNEYEAGHDVVWTAHKWDINGLNISRDLLPRDPYQTPWVSSHLRTFKASLLDQIPESNFQDNVGDWFKRGYDQALMLPLLTVASSKKYVSEVCYLYNIESCSISDRDWAEAKQLQTINFVRSRGFLHE